VFWVGTDIFGSHRQFDLVFLGRGQKKNRRNISLNCNNLQFQAFLDKCFVEVAKAPIRFVMSVRPSVRPSACISAVPTKQISMTFDIGDS
jgi:hypothetical protein